MPESGPARRATGPGGRTSVLRRVSVDRELSVSPGRQLERQLAVMVREGRLEPGRRLPSTRRLAPAVGLHRNTVAAAYRRLAARGLLEMRHGARARVWPDPPVGGRRGRPRSLVAAAADAGTARLVAAEVREVMPPGTDVEPVVVDEPGHPGAAEERLVAALAGPALRRVAGAPDLEPPGRVIRLVQDRRERIREALLRAPPLAVVVVVTGCPLLREAVLCDARRLRGRELSLHAALVQRTRPATGAGRLVPAADVVIADRLAADAFCGGSPSKSAPAVARVRLLSPESVAAVAGGVGGRGAAEIVRDRDR